MVHKIEYIDVFTDKLGYGNPVAVIFDADDLTDAQMQKIANWTNLSETTFIQSPSCKDADYKLRIFTPKSELPFAGHPTIGSCFAALNSNSVVPKNGKIVQECAAGLIEINISETIEFRLPKAEFTDLDQNQLRELSNILGKEIIGKASIVNVGPKWIIAEIEDDSAVLAIKPDLAKMKIFEKALGATGVTIFGKYKSSNKNESDDFIEVRSFAPSDGIEEDPVCGSGNGAVCSFMLENAIAANNFAYTARQGRAIGRNGKIFARIDSQGEIYIGGTAVLGVHGVIEI